MANMQQSPSLSTKLKTRNAANKMKQASPKLQEVLRQRCRQRMREKRGQLFNVRRPGLIETDEAVQKQLTEIVRHELSQLATLDVDGENLILAGNSNVFMTQEEALDLENEFIAEEEQWIFQEFERLLQDEAEALALFAEDSLKEVVICPLCVKGAIAEVPDFLACSVCNFRMPLKASAKDFGKMIQNNIELHSSSCCGQPGFMLLPENNTVSLYLTCETCSIFSVII